jgi:hypothetical protein
MNEETPKETVETPAKRTGLRRRSVRVLLGLVIAAILVRAVLPGVLRRVVVSQADKALIGRIEIDDIDLALLMGGITVKGLRIYADDLPAAETDPARSVPPATTAHPSPSGETATSPSPMETKAEVSEVKGAEVPTADGDVPAATKAVTPVFSAARLSVYIGWRALLDKIVELRSIELEHFDARIDRLQNGTLVLPQPVPGEPEPAAEEPAPESERPGWGVLLQRLALRDGSVSFRDFTIDPEAKPLTAAIPSLDASNMALLVTDAGLQPGNVALDAEILGGHLTVELTQRTLPGGSAFQSHVVLTDVPISDARVYIPRMEWTALDGRLDIDLKHNFEPDGPHDLSGTVTLRDMAIRVAGADAPALAWKNLAIGVADVDVVKHSAHIAEIALEGAHVVARASGPEPLPVLRGLMKDDEPAAHAASSSPKAAATSAQAPAQASAKAAPSTPWSWQLDKASIRDATVDVLGGETPLVLGVSSEVTSLSSAPKTRSNLTLKVTPPEGTLALAGAFTIDPIGFDGALKLANVSLPPLSSPVATPMTRLLQRGTLSTDLKIAAGATAAAPADGAKISGTASLDEVVITGDDDKVFSLRWKQLAVDIESILAPGVLAKKPADGNPTPPSVALSSFTFQRPELVITRTEKGIVLPQPLGGSETGEGQAEEPGSKAEDTSQPEIKTTAAEPQSDAGSSSQDSSPVDVRIGRVSIEKMRIAVTDKAVKPLYRSSLDPIDFSATDLRWPGPYANAVNLTARGLDGAKLSVTGDVAPTGSKITVNLDGMPLSPLQAYAATAGYGLRGGTASLHSKIKLTGEDYDTENNLVLNKLQVTGTQGDSLFASQFGMPLSLALALMTDLQGNITLNLPVSGGRKGASFGIGTAIRDALKQAILSTATSPLKLIGAVAEIGQTPTSLTPPPVSFALGRNREEEGEAAKIDRLGKFLSSSTALVLRLHGETSDDDRRWLAEQKLRSTIEAESGLMGSVRHIGEGGDREAALAYLEARAEDKPAELPEDHQPWFDAALAKQKVTDDDLRALARQRAEAVRDRLLSVTKVAPGRIVIDPIAPEDLAARPAVSITLETADTAEKVPAP